MNGRKKSKGKTLLDVLCSRYVRLLFSLIIFSLVLLQQNLEQLVKILFSPSTLTIFVMTLVINLINVFVSSSKLTLLLNSYDEKNKLSTKETFIIYLRSVFFGIFIPTSFGGDGSKFYFLHKQQKQRAKSEIVISIFLERFTGIAALFLLIMISVIHPEIRSKYFSILTFLGQQLEVNTTILLVTAVALTVGIAVIAIVFVHHRRRIKMPNKLSTRTAFYVVVLSVLFQLIMIFNNYQVFRQLNNAGSFPDFLIFVPLLILATMLPISIQGIGVRDYLALVILQLLIPLVNTEQIAAYTIIMNFIVVSTALVGGIVNTAVTGTAQKPEARQ